ncbi:MAG: fumarate reductase subunit C [Sulfurimonas sp.]
MLGVFIMGHIIFESSILISNEMMYKVSLFFEGYYFFGETYPGITSFLAAAIFFIFILHAGVAIRKFPNNYKQYKAMKKHTLSMKHEDTSMWVVQIITGFIMFFIGSVHLYTMMAEPSTIGPFASSMRVVYQNMAPLYFLLLISVIFHAFIGLYRLALKWGFMEGKDTKVSRRRFKILMRSMIVIYILLGLMSLMRYMYIGYSLDKDSTQRYKSEFIHLDSH